MIFWFIVLLLCNRSFWHIEESYELSRTRDVLFLILIINIIYYDIYHSYANLAVNLFMIDWWNMIFVIVQSAFFGLLKKDKGCVLPDANHQYLIHMQTSLSG